MSVANTNTSTSRRALPLPKAAEKLGVGLSTLWMWIKNEPDFPKPFKQGPRLTFFFEDELDQYLNACANKSRSSAEA